jgi:hypothetical protein
MEPASTIIRELGGIGPVSTAAGVHRTRVYKWMQPREKGGTGGVIPYWHVQKLLEHARAEGIAIKPEHFLPSFSPSASPSDLPQVVSPAGA